MRAALLFVLVFAAVAEHSQHVQEVLAVVRQHSRTNPVFAELEAAAMTAAEQGSYTEESKSGRSPIAEVAAMTDMMVIQTSHEIATLTNEHKSFQKMCKKTLKKYALNIEKQLRIENEELAAGNANFVRWVQMLPKLPAYDRQMRRLRNSIIKNENSLGAAGDRRKKKHKAFLQALDEHYKALRDVANIRKILQESKVDDRGSKSATNSGGAKTASAATVKKFVEMKANVHPRLNNLVELASRSTESEEALDKVYRLLYKTRDQLNESMEKLIKNEQSSVSNWRTNKIAFRSDINDLKILKETAYMNKGTTKRNIGLNKKEEGRHKQTMQKAIKLKETDQILRDFLTVSCKEAAEEYYIMVGIKRGEKKALQAVQQKLVSMKWSKKAYAAVDKVSEGVTYLNGEYNIRSNLGRFLINNKGTAQFAPSKEIPDAGIFNVTMNADDMTFSVISKVGKKLYYLQEDGKNGVRFLGRGPEANDLARFRVVFDKKSNSFFFRNKQTKNTLYVDAKKGYVVNTVEQTFDAASEFKVERNDYEQMGCYKNKIGKQLEFYLGSDNSLTTASCFAQCKASGKTFTHFGMSEGKMCFCGTKWDQTRAPESDCGYLCKGRDGDLCGGNFRTLIYKVIKKKPVVIPAYQGKFCAQEHTGKPCKCKGTIYYGAGKNPKHYASRVSTTQLDCSNRVFGDPIRGVRKNCYCHEKK
jgi:hypothetical protein